MNKSYHKISKSFPNLQPSLPVVKTTSYTQNGVTVTYHKPKK